MKKIILGLGVFAVIVALLAAWLLLGSATSFSNSSKYLYVASNAVNKQSVIDSIEKNDLIKNTGVFNLVANQLNVWDDLKAGRYQIKKGDNIISIVRMLRNNRQSSVNLVINKLRTKADLAKLIGKNFEADSSDVSRFLNNEDSLAKFGVNEATLMTLVIPDTYSLLWTTSTSKIIKRLKNESEKFWDKKNRKQKAEKLGIGMQGVYTIASIVEEETNKHDEKGNVASVYLNRLKKGMPLGADPTIKFALQDFSIKRILYTHLQTQSPYNTYKNAGLPPGPICTPSAKSIDAVLNAPETDYIFFVAKSDFSGYHTFTTNFADHIKYAKEYQKKLDEYLARKSTVNKP